MQNGQTLTFNSSGQVKFGPERTHTAQPAGARLQRGPNAPLPTAPLGALIGRIDDGQPFLIGAQRSVRMPASGTLHLRVNDDIDTDNSGSFQVTIEAR